MPSPSPSLPPTLGTLPVVDSPRPNALVLLSKSQSTGTVARPNPPPIEERGFRLLTKTAPPNCSLMQSTAASATSTSRSIAKPVAARPTVCSRNPSFFRKSPLDPSIDDLLQQYKGRVGLSTSPEVPKSPTSHERAVKLRQAREAFLSVGPGAFHSPSVSPTTSTFPAIDDMAEQVQIQYSDEQTSSPKSSRESLLVENTPVSNPSRSSSTTSSQDGWGSLSFARPSWIQQTRTFFSKPKFP